MQFEFSKYVDDVIICNVYSCSATHLVVGKVFFRELWWRTALPFSWHVSSSVWFAPLKAFVDLVSWVRDWPSLSIASAVFAVFLSELVGDSKSVWSSFSEKFHLQLPALNKKSWANVWSSLYWLETTSMSFMSCVFGHMCICCVCVLKDRYSFLIFLLSVISVLALTVLSAQCCTLTTLHVRVLPLSNRVCLGNCT